MQRDPTANLRALEARVISELNCADTSNIGLLRLRMDVETILSIRQTIRSGEEEVRKNQLALGGCDIREELA